MQAADLFFFSDPPLSLLEEGALGFVSGHDGVPPTPLQVRPYVLLLNTAPLLQNTFWYVLESVKKKKKKKKTKKKKKKKTKKKKCATLRNHCLYKQLKVECGNLLSALALLPPPPQVRIPTAP